METEQAARQEARRIIVDVARVIDRRLAVEVRDLPGEGRLQLHLAQGGKHAQLEIKMDDVLSAADDTMARNQLRLRIKRASDAMLFRPMPNHRVQVKSIPPPGGPHGHGGARGRR